MPRFEPRRGAGVVMSGWVRDDGRAKIAWLSFSLVIIGALVLAFALINGQRPSHVGFGPGKLDVDFAAAAGSGLSQQDIEREQSSMKDRIARLEVDARSGGSFAQQPSADLNGRWLGANGLTYVIQQNGSRAVIQEWSGSLVTAAGQGSVQGQQATFQVQAINGVTTAVNLTFDGADTLQGTFSNAYFGVAPAAMTRPG